jgi:acetyl esterase/lipase
MSAYGLRGLSGRALSKLDVAMNPFLSPGWLDIPLEMSNGRKTFADYPPTYVSVGGREILYDEILLTASRIQDHAAHERLVAPRSSASATETEYAWVTVDEEPDMSHDFTASPFAKTEALRTFDRISQWMAALPPGREYPV